MEKNMSKKCNAETEVWSRVVGFHRPIQDWNKGKQEEFKDRKLFDVKVEKEKKEEE